MAAHPQTVKKSFNCRHCGHHRIDHGQGDEPSCFKCDCGSYRERGKMRKTDTNQTTP